MLSPWTWLFEWMHERAMARQVEADRVEAEKTLLRAGYCLKHRLRGESRGTRFVRFYCPTCDAEYEAEFAVNWGVAQARQVEREAVAKRTLGWGTD